MQRFTLLFFSLFILFTPSKSWSDVIPADRGSVHYIAVYFEENFQKNVHLYELKVYADSTQMLKDSAVFVMRSAIPAFRAEALEWGKHYFWKVNTYSKKDKLLGTGVIHQFHIVPKVSSDFFEDVRIDVKTNKSDKHAGGFLVIDYLRGIYDRSGNAVWLLPPAHKYVGNGTQIRDLEFTPDNTLTFLSDNHPVEIDLEGTILWSLPSPYVFRNDTIIFHHDMKKTKQGTYFMLGNKSVYRRLLVDYTDELKKLNRDVIFKDGQYYVRTDVAILLELDHEGNVLWFWDAGEYLQDVDLNHKKTPLGFPLVYTHANALGVNTENTKAYIGFRDLSRIIKIDKQNKKVEWSYGEKYPSGEAQFGDQLFRQQHDARVTDHNSILILNNNGARKTASASSIMELRDNIKPGDSLVIWKFDLDFDSLTEGRSNSGGNVTELPNSNILLCAGQLNRIFEVSRSKEIVWDAFILSFGKNDSVWKAMPNYRSSWIKDFSMDHTVCDLLRLEKKRHNTCGIEVKLYNVNGKGEVYEVEVKDEQGNSLYKRQTEMVGPGNNILLKIDVGLNPASKANLLLIVKSVHNPTNVKKLSLTLN